MAWLPVLNFPCRRVGPSVAEGHLTADPTGRRAFLKVAAGLGLAGLGLSALNACTAGDRPDHLTVAGGETGGFYLEFATLFAGSLQRHGVAGTAGTITTGGSLENIERLLAGEATFAVALADAAADKAAGSGMIAAVGKVYENYLHCIVRKDSGILDFRDLGGRTVATGGIGSGTSFTARRLIAVAGLRHTSGKPVREVNLGLNEGLAALRSRSVDALLWSGGVPTAAITSVNKELGLRLLDASAFIPAMRDAHGAFYDRVLIYEDSYQGTPSVATVGVANLLLCRRDLDDRTVRKTVELLVGHAQEVIPRTSLGVQFLSRETLINTAGLPLHPAAATAYRTLHG